ncbi:hypothetical protein [Calothrix sp. PCC 6303]|uniref:hypothetical protein n=1 Tax=Calothrix sp. PCC 6303 TaxID=1170562 RepID=UPI00030C6FE5|nr:hypothetical protein [Calothrix sp. PCC 6303]
MAELLNWLINYGQASISYLSSNPIALGEYPRSYMLIFSPAVFCTPSQAIAATATHKLIEYWFSISPAAQYITNGSAFHY